MYVGGLLAGCSLDANIENLAGSKILLPKIRHEKDFQQAEVYKSGHYEVHGQIGELAEKKTAGQYVIEGMIAYE
ncbi:hypothetical protein [Bdellovibrio sp.]|uniref:hypothetical protein n=1 Tax=Bdellovibrio TaxID=958 RepID=UPI0032218A67